MVSCDHWKDGTCSVVAKLTGCCQRLCHVSPEACNVCLACDRPQALNKVTASIGMAVAKQHAPADKYPEIRDLLATAITTEKPAPRQVTGPGTELKKVLGKLGISERPGCKCNSRAREMDHRGLDWCRNNVEMIVDWLREEAQAQGLPFVELGARMLVRYAIRRAAKCAS